MAAPPGCNPGALCGNEGSTPSFTTAPEPRALPAVVVNSADTSVFQTEAEGSMPSGRSRSGALAPDAHLGSSVGQSAALRMRRPQVQVLAGVRARRRGGAGAFRRMRGAVATPAGSGPGDTAFDPRASDFGNRRSRLV